MFHEKLTNSIVLIANEIMTLKMPAFFMFIKIFDVRALSMRDSCIPAVSTDRINQLFYYDSK